MARIPGKPHDESLAKRLQDPEYLTTYLRAVEEGARKQAFLDAIRIVSQERLEEPTTCEGDQAYDIAIGHAVESLRREAKKQSPEE